MSELYNISKDKFESQSWAKGEKGKDETLAELVKDLRLSRQTDVCNAMDRTLPQPLKQPPEHDRFSPDG